MTVPADKPSAREALYFDSIKEHRGAYFVEYVPPVADVPFATMNIVFVDETEDAAVISAMMEELRLWLKRYPVPLMITAWDAKENMLRPNGKDNPHLTGWQALGSTEVVCSWQFGDLSAFTKSNPPPPDWRTIYKDVPVKTDAEVKANAARFAAERRKQNRFLKGVLFAWIAGSVGIALFQYFGPEWLGLIALLISLSQAGWAAYRLWRNSKPMPWEVKEVEKKRKMDHYFYHCERNPEGFARLVTENFEREAEARTKREAEALTKQARPKPVPSDNTSA